MKHLILTLVFLFSFNAYSDYSAFVGVNTGLSTLKGVNTEASKNGYLMGVKGLLTSSFDTFVLDAGLGYYVQEVTSSDVYIKTKTATIDLDARYVLPNDYQLGLGLRSDLGTDNSGTEYIGKNSQSNMLFAKMIFPDKFNSFPIRYEIGLGSSVGQDRNLTSAYVGIQIGLPETRKVVSPKVVEKPKEDVGDLKVDLKLAKIYFPTNRHELDERAKNKLSELASFLAKNQKYWNRLKISGHTDIQGKAEDNDRLSQDRADEVLKLLIQNGVNENNVSSYGYGSRKPASLNNDDQGLQQNRRTEIEFFGVTNRKQFNKDLVDILTGKQ